MTDAEIFHRKTIHLGGRVMVSPEISAESPEKKTYDRIAERARDLISCATSVVPRLPYIHFDFVLSEKINAYAFKADGRYFIGLTAGTIYMFNLVIMRMLPDSRLFPDIGNPSGEADNLPPLTNFVPDAEHMYSSGFIPNPPKTAPRFHYANYLVDQALLFLVGHEIAHITLGHVDYLQSKNGTGLIAEIGWNQNDSEGLIERQCLEMEADMRSVFSRMDSIKQTLSSSNIVKPSWSDSHLKSANMIYDWSFGMNVLFRLFGDIQFNSVVLSTESYPPLALRRAIAVYTEMNFVMNHWNPKLEYESAIALREAMHYTELAFATILGKDISSKGLTDAFSPLGLDHYKRLIDCFNNSLTEKLAPFAYELTPRFVDSSSEVN